MTSPVTNETFTKVDAIAGFKKRYFDSIYELWRRNHKFKRYQSLSSIIYNLSLPKAKQATKDPMVIGNEVYTKAEMKNIEELFGQMVELEQPFLKEVPLM